ncbi:hypothetical protein Dimus_007249 [Dionaea muscipula]
MIRAHEDPGSRKRDEGRAPGLEAELPSPSQDRSTASSHAHERRQEEGLSMGFGRAQKLAELRSSSKNSSSPSQSSSGLHTAEMPYGRAPTRSSSSLKEHTSSLNPHRRAPLSHSFMAEHKPVGLNTEVEQEASELRMETMHGRCRAHTSTNRAPSSTINQSSGRADNLSTSMGGGTPISPPTIAEHKKETNSGIRRGAWRPNSPSPCTGRAPDIGWIRHNFIKEQRPSGHLPPTNRASMVKNTGVVSA